MKNTLYFFLLLPVFLFSYKANAQVAKIPYYCDVVNDNSTGPPCWTSSPNTEQTVQMAMDSAGNYVIVWGVTDPGQVGLVTGAYMKKFDKNGLALGPETLVSTDNGWLNSIGSFANPYDIAAVAMSASGNFVVTYCRLNSSLGIIDVYAKIFNSAGVQQGPEIAVTAFAGTALNPLGYCSPHVAMDNAGNFTVVWQDINWGHVANHGQNGDVYIRRYNMAGSPLGPQQRLPGNTTTTFAPGPYNRVLPSISMNRTNGDFVITWDQQMASNFYMWNYDVWAQKFSAAGYPQIPAFKICSNAWHPFVSMNDSDGFVITYAGLYAGLAFTSYAADGTIKGEGSSLDNGMTPNVAINNGGDFIFFYIDNNTLWPSLCRYHPDATISNSLDLSGQVGISPYYDGGGCSIFGVLGMGKGASAMNDRGDYVTAFNDDQADNEQGTITVNTHSTLEIFAQRFSVNVPPRPQGSFCVSNTLGVGATIGKVQVANERTQLVSNYTITSGNTGNAFSINAITGVITIINPPNWGSNPTYTLTISATDNGNAYNPPATGSGQVVINTVIPAAPTSVTPGSFCGPGSVMLGAATATGSPQWFSSATSGTGLGTGIYYGTPPLATTTTYYVGTNYDGCQSATRTPIIATIYPIPTVKANTNTTSNIACNGQLVTFTGSGASTYIWEAQFYPAFNITNGVPRLVFGPVSLAVVVLGTDVNGCQNLDTLTLNVLAASPPTVTASASADTVFAGNHDTLRGGGASTYVWSSGVSNGVGFVPLATATYTVTGTATDGCINTTTKRIVVESVLPIELIEFDAVRQEEKAKLTWTTATEKNNNYFTVMRSVNGYEWDDIGTVKGAGNSTSDLYYAFYDDNAASAVDQNGILYYRIRQTDYDGNEETFNVKSVLFQSDASAMKAYPNPVSDNLNISMNTKDAITGVEIINSLGQVVYTANTLLPGASINTSGLAEGLYLIIIKTETTQQQQKFIKVELK